MEKVPSVEPRKKETPEELYESGRRYGLHQAEKIVDSLLDSDGEIRLENVKILKQKLNLKKADE